jgi:hypothetical protein
MQIEQIIGGIGGDATAQAIQLRTGAEFQNFVSNGRLKAWNANGTTSVLLLDIAGDVSDSSTGVSILLTTPAFNSKMAAVPGYATDFTLSNVIPASFLTGGKVTFEDDFGTIYWSLAFGAYTGSNTGSFTNDGDGNFGAPFPSALPINGARGIRFLGAATDQSTTNQFDYALTPDPATVRNSSGNSFTVVPEPGSVSFIAFGTMTLGGLFLARRRRSLAT